MISIAAGSSSAILTFAAGGFVYFGVFEARFPIGERGPAFGFRLRAFSGAGQFPHPGSCSEDAGHDSADAEIDIEFLPMQSRPIAPQFYFGQVFRRAAAQSFNPITGEDEGRAI